MAETMDTSPDTITGTSSPAAANATTKVTKDGTREIRKRQRQWLSCEACHKMKVKCDRQQPCGRCARGDRADRCVYEIPKKKPNKSGRMSNGVKEPNCTHTPAGSIEESPEKFVKYRKGKVRHGGRTHWALIAHEFTEMKQFMHGEIEGTEALSQRIKALKKFFPRKRLQNYPFTPSREPRYSSRDGIIATLPDRQHVKRLVDVYFDTFEKILSLFHEPTFKAALDTFYDHPDSVENGWISSLFLMLALSHHITTQSSIDAPYLSASGQVEAYLESAQAALHLSPFMLKPTLDSLRALCIVAIGKSLEIITLDDTDTLYIYSGFIVRYAFALGMHRDPKYAQGMPAAEAQARRKVWTTILFLDLRISIESGMPLLIRSTDFDTAPPQDTFGVLVYDSSSAKAPNESDPSAYQYRLAQSIKVVADIVSVINSPSPSLKYDRVLAYDAALRGILRDFPALRPEEQSNDATHLLQRASLSIFIHRVLLALHQPYATDPQVWKDYPTSHYSVLQCALGILGLQRLIFNSSSTLSVPLSWLHELYRHDFMVAALYTCVALRRDQFSDAGQDGVLSKEQAKQTAWETILGVKEIWQRDCTNSVHSYKVYLGTSLIITALTALQSGANKQPSDAHNAMRETADAVIAEVTARMGASTHSSVSSATVNTDVGPPGSAGGSGSAGGMLDFMFFDSMNLDPSFFGTGWDAGGGGFGQDYGGGWGPQGLGFDFIGDAPASGLDLSKRTKGPTMWYDSGVP